MFDFWIPRFIDSITDLRWYQFIGESLAIALFISSLVIDRVFNTSEKEKMTLWKNFIRSSSFLLAFATIAIPWMISEIL